MSVTTRIIGASYNRKLQAFLLGIVLVFLFLYSTSEPNEKVIKKLAATSLSGKLVPSGLIEKLDPPFHPDLFALNVTLPQNDSLILNELLQFHLVPPPPLGSARLSKNIFVPYIQSDMQNIFKGKKNGFFIECGANDGEFLSNTLGLEVNYNWTGLLVEASPKYFAKLKNVKRNAWTANICLSGAKPEKVEYIICNGTGNNKQWSQGQGKVKPDEKTSKHKSCMGDEYTVETVIKCFPLYSILSAINVTYVDFFSLDVEGHEYKVLQAFPFDRIFIKMIQVEYWWTPEGKEAISDLLVSHGYKMIYDSPNTDHEFVFVKDK